MIHITLKERLFFINELLNGVVSKYMLDIFEEKSISLSTVSRTIRQLSWKPSNDTDKESPGIPPNLCNERLILNELQENPEISCRQIARQTKIPYSTVNYTLTHRLNYKSVHTQYAPHIFNEEDKMIKIQCGKEILIILKKCQKKRLHVDSFT